MSVKRILVNGQVYVALTEEEETQQIQKILDSMFDDNEQMQLREMLEESGLSLSDLFKGDTIFRLFGLMQQAEQEDLEKQEKVGSVKTALSPAPSVQDPKGDYREIDRQNLEKQLLKVEDRTRRLRDALAHADKSELNSKEAAAIYSSAITNAARAAKLAEEILMYGMNIVHIDVSEWNENKMRSYDSASDPFVDKLIQVEDVLR